MGIRYHGPRSSQISWAGPGLRATNQAQSRATRYSQGEIVLGCSAPRWKRQARMDGVTFSVPGPGETGAKSDSL